MTSEVNNEQTSLVTCCYQEPKWSGICADYEYGLDVLKNGIIIDNIKLTQKPYYVIGRYKTCDLIFEHPSLSRFHSILQYCLSDNEDGKERGWYIMDLDSTHGTIVNKKRIPSHTFVRIHTGHVLKFGGSTRLYIVTGPEDDKEQMSKYTWTELMEAKKNPNVFKVADSKGYLPSDDNDTSTGCMWGMKEMAEDEENQDGKEVIKYKHEHLYKDDPKKVIKLYFEREGFDEAPQYEFSKVGFNKNICKLELPVFGENGEKIVAEVSGSDKKKDLITRCAFESCRILDEMDELYKIGGSARRRKKDNKYYEEKDYYSSEEDDFLDRTGQIEAKRVQRMRRFGVVTEAEEEIREDKVEAKDSNSSIVKFIRLEEINDEILSIEDQLEEARLAFEAGQNSSELDEIEKYLEALQSGALNKKMRLKLRASIFELTKEENLLRKQLRLSIPVTVAMRKSLYQCKDNQEKPITENISNNIETVIPTKQPNAIKEMILSTDSDIKNVDHAEEEEEEEEGEEENDEDKDKEMIHTVETISEIKVDDKVKRKIEEDQLNEMNSDSEAKQRKVFVEVEDTEEIITWVPPSGQTGDGKTSLNEKWGY